MPERSHANHPVQVTLLHSPGFRQQTPTHTLFLKIPGLRLSMSMPLTLLTLLVPPLPVMLLALSEALTYPLLALFEALTYLWLAPLRALLAIHLAFDEALLVIHLAFDKALLATRPARARNVQSVSPFRIAGDDNERQWHCDSRNIEKRKNQNRLW